MGGVRTDAVDSMLNMKHLYSAAKEPLCINNHKLVFAAVPAIFNKKYIEIMIEQMMHMDFHSSVFVLVSFSMYFIKSAIFL